MKRIKEIHLRLDSHSRAMADMGEYLAELGDKISNIQEALNKPPNVGEPSDAHTQAQAWWIIETERDVAGKVGLSYWGPFPTDAMAQASPLYKPERTNQCLALVVNPPMKKSVTSYRAA